MCFITNASWYIKKEMLYNDFRILEFMNGVIKLFADDYIKKRYVVS